MQKEWFNQIKKNKSLMLQLFLFIMIAVAFFYVVKWFGIFITKDSKFVTQTADNVYNYREFILNLVFRVMPLLIPILIATASLMLNKYTSIYLTILLEDRNVRWLLIFSCSFFTYHAFVVFYTPQGTWTDINQYYLQFYLFFVVDSIFSSLLLVYSIYTISQVFLYSQPAKLSISFTRNINNITKRINKYLFQANPMKNEVAQNTTLLKQYIANFTNLIVLAVKSKDNETIRESIQLLAFDIWSLILKQVNIDDKYNRKKLFKEFCKIHRGFGRSLSLSELREIQAYTSTRMDTIIEETNTAFNTTEDQVAQVYKDVFETAFSSKEFYACDIIIKNLYEVSKSNRISTERVLLILSELFDIVIFYKHNGYSQTYCDKIVETIESILFDSGLLINSLVELEVYYRIIKQSIYHKEPQIFKVILKSLRNILNQKNYSDQIDIAYRNILYAGMYCLEIKSMKCFATLIRYLVTEKFNLELLNISFAKLNYLVKQKSVEFEDDDFFNLLDSIQQHTNDENIFNINKEKKYLLLKFYVVFYSYYKLQMDISTDRIDSRFHDLAICEDLYGNIPFYQIRTVLLDYETHSKKWNELFVEHSKVFLVNTAIQLMDKSNLADKHEIDIFKDNSHFLKLLYEKVGIRSLQDTVK